MLTSNVFEPTGVNFRKVQLSRVDEVDVAALEKDWYLVEAIKLLQTANLPVGAELIFNGGTSLSKQGIITRFSEDADFVVFDGSGNLQTDSTRKAFRMSVQKTLEAAPNICSAVERKAHDGGRQIIYDITYPSDILEAERLHPYRPHIRLEIRIDAEPTPKQQIAVSSLVGETIGAPPDLMIAAVTPLQIAANKLVGLAWRVLKRARSTAQLEDRNLVRHVHDLAALESFIIKEPLTFQQLVSETVLHDRPRYGKLGIEPATLLVDATCLLTDSQSYEAEYQEFVSRMSYAVKQDRIQYKDAFAAYLRIVNVALPSTATASTST